MNFGDAWEGAGLILAFFGVLGITAILIPMTQNIGNPEYDMMEPAKEGIFASVGLLEPAPVITFILAVVIFLLFYLWNSQ